MPNVVKPPATEPIHRSQELQLRIVSAAALGSIALALAWSGVWTFALLAGAVGLIVAWEWDRLVRGVSLDAAYMIGAVATVSGICLAASARPLAGAGAVVVGAIGAGLAVPASRGATAIGVAYAALPALALVWIRSDATHGLEALLFLLVVVWATDVGAFAAGRTIGGVRLLPSVSPNKTWSGLVGGVLAAGVVGGLIAVAVGSGSWGRVAGLAMGLGVLSQAGDLFESAMKRRRGVKDASHLIPGHGGFMDRVDGLIVAALAAALFAALVDPTAPGASLLGLPPPR
jgi:phosphatidate cytidylyltransferase